MVASFGSFELTFGDLTSEHPLSLANILKGAIILAVFILLFCTSLLPSRYEVVHTLTRCKCWILFSWITAILSACPVLITKMEANYSSHLELCLLNWSSSTLAYSLTLGILVCLPSLCTLAFTGFAIFTAMQKPDELEDIQRSILETDQNFAFTWLAIGGGSSKLLIYSFTSKQFRHSLFCCRGFFFTSREQPPPSPQPKIVEERLLENSISGLATQNQHQQQHPNINSPIINAYSFLASFDYGSFGLGPNGGFLTEKHPKQQNNYFNRQRDY
uniref:G_PROTEIN_RECEP_F1_2 domain-containing protein n=1 Tax=Meloidogyne hapla TaxID=6305 RepID=A0A1I8BEY7_MELHA